MIAKYVQLGAIVLMGKLALIYCARKGFSVKKDPISLEISSLNIILLLSIANLVITVRKALHTKFPAHLAHIHRVMEIHNYLTV